MPALRSDTSRTAKMMQAFENFTQSPYGFVKYRQTVAEGYSTSMEHQSATTMGGRRIVGDGSGESVVAHELAHQWFGDLVTCGIWGDTWLNEGFASYLPSVFFAAEGNRDDVFMSMIGSRDWYFSSTTAENARALSTPEEWPSYDIFDQHSYAKGSMVIHLMRHLANKSSLSNNGVEPFSRALGRYIYDHAYGNVRYFDLKNALAQTTGNSWDQFFNEWVLKPGHPEVSATWNWRGGVLSLSTSQDQAILALNPWGTFTFPLNIAILATDGSSFVQEVLVNQKSQTFNIPAGKSVKAVVLDPSMIIPGKFTVNQSLEAWTAAFFGTKEPFAQAAVLEALFLQFDDAALGPFVEQAERSALSSTTLALLARELKGRDGLLEASRRLGNNPLVLRASPVMRGVFAALEAWVFTSEPEATT